MINWADVRAEFPVTKNSVYLNTAAAGPLAESTARAGAFYYEQMMNDGDVHWDDWLAGCEDVRRRVAAFRKLNSNTLKSQLLQKIQQNLETYKESI